MLAKIRTLLPHKLRAFAIHFLLSLVIFAALLYLILVHWYPGPWFAIDGGWQGVRIMIGVDLVLGPMLTFMLFNPGKSRRALGIDFSFIALVQTAALVWGIYAVHGQRPLAIVYWDGTFHSLDAKSEAFKAGGISVLDPFGERRPVLVLAQEPDDPKKKLDLVMQMFTTGRAEYEHPDMYRPLDAHLDKAFSKQVDIAALRKKAPQAVDRLLRRHPDVKLEDLRFVYFVGRYEEATLVFRKDGQLIGHLPSLAPPIRGTGKRKGLFSLFST